MNADPQADTAPDLQPFPTGNSGRPLICTDTGARTHVGKVRTTNEDNFHVVQFGRYLRTVHSSLHADDVRDEIDRLGYGFTVADGMGGHAAGEVASRIAIGLLVECVLQTPDWILGNDTELLLRVMDRTAGRFRTVNEAVLAAARSQPGQRGMGTTLTMAATLRDDLIVAHVGDSPAYLFRAGRLMRLTRDHTLGQEQAKFDAVNAARFRHVLTRAIGIGETGGAPDIERYKLTDGDRLLLCTDGLTDTVTDDVIADMLGRGAPADETCLALIDLALEGGGRDNVTVIVATYHLVPEPPPTEVMK